MLMMRGRAGARGAIIEASFLFGDPGGEHRQHERLLGGGVGV